MPDTTINEAAPLISVAMPFHDCELTLAAAIRSVLRQTCEDWELLLCDDGSTDHSLAIARAFRDPRIVVWTDQHRRGLAGRLNQCIDRARGTYIARMDADDITYPRRFEKQLWFLQQRRDIDLVGCHMLVCGEDGAALAIRELPCAHAEIVANPGIGFGMAHPTWMGRASWFRRYRYSADAARYEDIELLYRSYRESRFANIPEVLHGYREPRRGLRKRWKTRIGRVQFLRESRAEWSHQAVLIEPVKAICDALLVGAGLRYAMLKRRDTAPAAPQLAEWQEINAGCTEQEVVAP
jgi:glycosyltransferase involved in cell wall biosynthesis